MTDANETAQEWLALAVATTTSRAEELCVGSFTIPVSVYMLLKSNWVELVITFFLRR